jgi:tetratricopeptide (TPR) repeat protein
MGWETKRWSQQIAALYSALDVMGCPMGYDELMVGSGAAFCIAWWPGWYSYGAPEITPEDLVLNGAGAAGAEAERPPCDSPDAVWEAICASIDRGCPVVSWKGRGYGSQVICGYDPATRQLHIRDYHTQGEPYKVAPFESPGTPWPMETENDIVLVRYDPHREVPELDWVPILERAIRFADWPAEELLYNTYVFGLGAYDAWAQTLRQGPDRNGAETDAIFTEYMTRVVGGARSSASVVLQNNAQLHEAFADAATHYMREAELLSTMPAVLSQGPIGEWNQVRQAMTANFPTQAVREQAAQLIEQAKKEEVMAVDALRVALADLGGAPAGTGPAPVQLPPPEPEPTITALPDDEQVAPASEVAQEHCERGRRLKDQRRYKEAAEELQAAIEADANYVEAHWVLGWVLIELKDSDGAAREFRKVIELAPGTDKAKEAQKALARLGK